MLHYSSLFKDSINTIYFGGGTPSILSVEEFETLMDSIEKYFTIEKLDEFTIECNPEDLHEEKMKVWKSRGVDRLSIGVQSFQNDILKAINRQHSKEIALEGIKRARSIFDRISVDLIVGLPGLNLEKLKDDLALLIAIDPEHVSAYQLSVEEKTSLAYDVKKGKIKLTSDEAINDQYRMLHAELKAQGFKHYEVSNYSKEGMEAVHNSSYWSGKPYLGIGPGAHSYNGYERIWNVSNNIKYARMLAEGNAWYEKEKLSEKDRFNEKIMISLRTSKGLSLDYLAQFFPNLYSENMLLKAQKWEANGWALLKNNNIYLTIEGWLISDNLASDLFIID